MANSKTIEAPKKARNIKANTVGIAQLFVIASICYSTYVVALGTSGWIPKAMLVPQALWAALLLIQKFTRNK